MSENIRKFKNQLRDKVLKAQDMTDADIAMIKEMMADSPLRGHESVPSLIPYRPTDADDFPIGSYGLEVTGKHYTHFFNLSDQYRFTNSDIISFIDECNLEQIHSREYYVNGSHSASRWYEMKDDVGVLLMNVTYMPLSGRAHRSTRDIATIRIYSNVVETIYNTIVEKVKSIAKKQKEESNNVSLVIATRNGYDTQSFELPKQQMNVELNYGKDFVKVHEKILGTLNKKKGKGLVLLHGTPGTGKTHYLKYLASKIRGKRVLFIPPHLADFITSPEMTPFLIQNANSILFIEDAERVITDRNTGGSVGVSNILNLTDGILSDILNIQIVATFNMDKRKIDEALLRKGRLIAEHEFGKLSVDDSNAVLKHLNIPYDATKPMTLTEIYNVNEAEYKSEEKGKSTIGFR
jgi:hypothetical protein